MRSYPSYVGCVLWRAGAPPRWQSVKVVQKCDIACTPFRAPHGPRAHPTVLHQCGRKVANQCGHNSVYVPACCGAQAHRHAGKVSKWCKSATLLAQPFEHLTDHVPTTVLHQCGRKVDNKCAQIPAASHACCGAQSHRHAGKVSKWCNSATLLAHPFEHLMDHVPTQQCCTNAVGRSPTSALISQLRRTRAVGCRRTTTLAKCQSGAKVRHCLHTLSSTTRTTCPPNSAAPMR